MLKAGRLKPKNGRDEKSLPLFGADSRNLIFSFILFLLTISYLLISFSTTGSYLTVSFTAIIIIYTIAYGFYIKDLGKKAKMVTAACFYLSIVLFIASTALYIALGQASFYYYWELAYVMAYIPMLLLLFFVLQLYFYSTDRRIRLFVIVVAVILVAIYFTPQIIGYKPDDEVIISYYGIKSLLAGVNPYSISIPAQLYSLHQSNGASLTISTNATLLSNLDYPALYILVQVPFYLIANPAPQDLAYGFMHTEGFAFVLLFLFAYMLVAEKRSRTGPNFLAYIALGFFVRYLSSMVCFLMLALLIVLYSDIGKKYSWIFLGLATALQEQLWIIVLLFIAYTFNSYGAKRGIREIAGVLAVFLMINGYFIASSPSSYISNFLAIPSTIFPSSLSPIGYILAASFNVSLHMFTYIFAISIVAALLISLYINERKLILLFSIIPFLFLGHATQIYYLLPIVAFAFVADVKEIGTARNWLMGAIKREAVARYAYACAFPILAILVILISMSSHQAYASQFNLSAHDIYVSASSNTLTYYANLSYNKGNETSMYLMVQVYDNNSAQYFGLFNNSIINNSLKCSFPCTVNVNRIALTQSGSYDLVAQLPANIPTPAYLSAVLSNNDYYYVATPTKYR